MNRAQTLVLALAAVIDDAQILLIERAEQPYRGYWGMPGGKLDFGETIEQAALREAEEETGLKLRLERICGAATEEIRDAEGALEAHFLMFVARLRPIAGTLRAGREGRLAWFSLSALDRPDIIPSDRIMIERFAISGNSLELPHFDVLREGAAFGLLP